MLQPPELDQRTERCLLDTASPADASTYAVAIILADAAGHVADALPELLVLARCGPHFDFHLRPYLNEVLHCLASALEATLIASHDAERAGIGAARRSGEDDLAATVTTFLDAGRG